MCVCVCVSCSGVSDSLRHHRLQPSRLLCPWDSPGKDTGVGCLFPSQGICLDPGSEPRSRTLQADSSPSEPPGKPFSYVYGLFVCLFSYLLHARLLCFCVKMFLPDMSCHRFVESIKQLLCIKNLVSCLILQRSLLFLLPTINH